MRCDKGELTYGPAVRVGTTFAVPENWLFLAPTWIASFTTSGLFVTQPKSKIRMFLTTNMSCRVGEQKKHYDDALLGGRETGLYSLMLSAFGHHLSLANILQGPHH